MDFEQKLKLSLQAEGIHFFHEGVFVHFYGRSLYIVVALLKMPLKINLITPKGSNGRCILQAGLPVKTLHNRFLNLVKTDYGFYLAGNWNLDGFKRWYQNQFNALQTDNTDIAVNINLAQQQFLRNWQPNRDWQKDMQFITQLRQQINS